MYNENSIYEMEKATHVYSGFSMKSKDRVFSVFMALLIVPFVVLTLWGGFNSGYTVSVIGFLTLFTAYLANKKVKFKFFPFICFVLSLVSAVVFTYSSDFAVRFFLFTLLTLMVSIWICYLGGYNMSDDYNLVSAVLIGIFGSAFGSLGKSLSSVFYNENKKKIKIGKIIAGIACAVPAMIILVLLLRSSDAAFDGMLSKIGETFGDLGSLIFKINVGLLFFPFTVSLGIGLAKK